MKKVRTPVLIGIAVFLLELGFLCCVQFMLQPYGGSVAHLTNGQDSEYIPLAHSLLDTGKFELPPRYFPTSNPVPETFRTPGYPSYIATVFTLFGGSAYYPGGPNPPDMAFYALLVSIAILGGITSSFVFLIGKKIGLTSIGASAAALLFGVSPAVLFLPVSGMGSDMLFVLSFTIALYLLLRTQDSSRPWLTAGSMGVLLGLGALTRPTGFYLAVLVVVSLPLFFHESWRRRISIFCIAVVGFLAVLMPWYLRNLQVSDHFALSSIPQYSAFYYNIPEYFSFIDNVPPNDTREELLAKVGNPDAFRLRGFEYTDRLAAIDVQFLKEHFFSYAFFHGIKMLPFFLGSGIDVQYAVVNIESDGKLRIPFMPVRDENLSNLLYAGDVRGVIQNLISFWPATIERLVWVLLFSLTALAPFFSKGRVRKFFILGVVLIAVSAVLASPVAQPRYRIPIEPIVWTAAFYSLSILIKRYRIPLL